MRVYIAGLTGDRQYVKSFRSFYDLAIRDGDEKNQPEDASRGDISRMSMCDDFLEKRQFDAILLLDMDMKHPVDLLERLREHDLDMVTAHYWKRKTPMESIVGIGDRWPYAPLKDLPDTGLLDIATTGFGAVLIKRGVVEAVSKSLPRGEHPMAIGPVPEMANGEVAMGSDMRFFYYARSLGYKLWLDCSLESLHACTVWLGRTLYPKLREPDWEEDQERQRMEINKRLYG